MSEVVELAREEFPSPGAMLARERAKKGMSVAEIAAQLRYSAKQIEALEGDDYARLPGTTFVRGMIRGYAKIIGTQAAPIIEALEKRHIPSPITVDLRATRVPFPDGKARSTKVYVWLCAVLLAVVAGVVDGWNFGLPQLFSESAPKSRPDSAKGRVLDVPAQARLIEAEASGPGSGRELGPEASTRASEAVPAIPVAAVPVPEVPVLAIPVQPIIRDAVRLRFEFQKDAWVEVKDRGGRTLIAQINPGGTQSIVQGTPPFVLIIGNATNVRVTYGDKPVDLAQHIKFDVARFTLD